MKHVVRISKINTQKAIIYLYKILPSPNRPCLMFIKCLKYELHTHAPKLSNRNDAFIGYNVFNWIFFRYMNKNRSRKFMTARLCIYFIISISGIKNKKNVISFK